MQNLTLILDGDNVLKQLNLIRGANLEAAEEFLTKLETAAAERDWGVVAIFDGPERFYPREAGPLVIQYAKPKQTADSVIERMVYEAYRGHAGDSPRKEGTVPQMVVVTRDYAIGDLVRGLGALVWMPERLAQELEQEPML